MRLAKLLGLIISFSTAAFADPAVKVQQLGPNSWDIKENGSAIVMKCQQRMFLSMGLLEDGLKSVSFTVQSKFEENNGFGVWGGKPFFGLKEDSLGPEFLEVSLFRFENAGTKYTMSFTHVNYKGGGNFQFANADVTDYAERSINNFAFKIDPVNRKLTSFALNNKELPWIVATVNDHINSNPRFILGNYGVSCYNASAIVDNFEVNGKPVKVSH